VLDDLLVVPQQSEELKRMLTFKDEQRSELGPAYAGLAADGRVPWRADCRRMETLLQETWVRLKLSPAPPTGAHYDSLKSVMEITGGVNGEVEAYMLRLGGLNKQLQTLEEAREERRVACGEARLETQKQGGVND